MNNVEYRQFLDEVYFIGEKFNKSIFDKIIPSINPSKSAKDILIKKRKAYDFSLAELLKKYNIDYDNMYYDFDKLWNEIDDSFAIGEIEIIGPQRIIKMKNIINTYLIITYLYCRRKAKENLEKKKDNIKLNYKEYNTGDNNNQNYYDLINSFALNYLREYSYKNGNCIYDFMKNYNIGESNYGKIMDAAAKDKHVMAHRLYGHHFLYDFPNPLSNTGDIAPFIEHLFSDLFTKQGLPIIPGKLIKDPNLRRVCSSLQRNWNFVNGFDILAGTVSIYQGFDKFIRTFNYDMSVDDFNSFANTIGVGGIELAISMSTFNPVLLIGAILHLTSGLKGMINDGATIYFKRYQQNLSIEFSVNTLNVNAYLERYSIENSIKELGIEANLPQFPYEV